MKTIKILLIAFLFASCSTDEICETKMAEFKSLNTGEAIHILSDCNKVPPEGYVFIKWMGKPEY